MGKRTKRSADTSMARALRDASQWFVIVDDVVRKHNVAGERDTVTEEGGDGTALAYMASRGRSELAWTVFVDYEKNVAECHLTLWVDMNRADPDFLLTFTSDGATSGWSVNVENADVDDHAEVEVRYLRKRIVQLLREERGGISDGSARDIIRHLVFVFSGLPVEAPNHAATA